ncbi:hypothetical protein [Saccharothrix hoggarensis]|uniref:Uncharacterized protein n=1 Tax=Saccharothrix hoggarensis TaxID=913853 RepID=A0ABW3QZ92_9PSEU
MTTDSIRLSEMGRPDWENVLWSSPTAQVLAARITWPDFLELDGCVYVLLPWDADRVSEHREYLLRGRRSVDWERLSRAERWSVAAEHGEVDLGVVFQMALHDGDDLDASLDALAALLVRSWGGALRERFPERRFAVEVEPADDDGGPVVRVREVPVDGA